MIKLIVGLANFKVKYFETRHNVGAWYIQKLIEYNGQLSLKQEEKFYGYTGSLVFYGTIVRLLIPTTYMNNSGISVLLIAMFYQFSVDEILIVHDELDLFPGTIKLKFSGGHNGHNGVKDIITKLKSKDFYRLRIGIGRPVTKDLILRFVLSKPSPEDLIKINEIIAKAVIYTKMIILKKCSKFSEYLNK